MPKLKWFLIGATVSMFVGDWLRLRVERNQMAITANRSVALAERMGKDVNSCISSIQGYQDIMNTTKVVTLARMQTSQLLTRAQQGDKDAVQELEMQGIPQKLKKKEFFITSALEE